jgi:hypothetical protein
MLAWIAILLPMRSPEVNGWATLLVCAYPVLEVGFSVRRRLKRSGQVAGQADKAHLHHFLHRRVVCLALPQLGAPLKNGLTSPLCWMFTLLPAGWAVQFERDTPMLVLGLALAVFAYAGVYARLTQFRWCWSALTVLRAPSARKPQPDPQQ